MSRRVDLRSTRPEARLILRSGIMHLFTFYYYIFGRLKYFVSLFISFAPPLSLSVFFKKRIATLSVNFSFYLSVFVSFNFREILREEEGTEQEFFEKEVVRSRLMEW